LAAVGASPHAEAFVRQLAWREFAYHVAHAQPELLDSPIKAGFSAMGWHEDPEAFEAWSRGMTGFPMVDAGMRQLEATGWMHNRVRLLTASLLTKHLLVRWQDGATFFERSLVDLDPVLNAFNWQWVAGSGADAAPYFRVFNPVVQGERFDTDGAYIRRWVPELAELPARWIQKPWLAPADVLRGAGVKLGVGYPAPIVDLAEGRVRALAAFAASKTSRD
jgi:deoxyribodipyrimidine photo-lyase